MKFEIRKRLGRIGLIFGGLTVGILCAECGIRLMEPRGNEFVLEAEIGSIPPDLYQPDPTNRTRLRANVQVEHQALEYRSQIQTNSLGIRGPELYPKEPDEIRILTIGDSFTLGIQVDEEETAGSVLAQSLGERWGRNVTAWNAGVDGYGTRQATELAREIAPQIDADIVFLRFYLGNDLRDNELWEAGALGQPPEIPDMEGAPPSESLLRFHRLMSRWSRLYAEVLVWNTTRQMRDDPRILEMADELWPYVDLERLELLLPATQAALQSWAGLCAELSMVCVISWAPPAYAIHTERADSTFDVFGFDATQSDPQRVLNVVNTILPRGVVSCDPSPMLREASENQSLYFVYDPHWNENGHRIAGRSDADCIASSLEADSF